MRKKLHIFLAIILLIISIISFLFFSAFIKKERLRYIIHSTHRIIGKTNTELNLNPKGLLGTSTSNIGLSFHLKDDYRWITANHIISKKDFIGVSIIKKYDKFNLLKAFPEKDIALVSNRNTEYKKNKKIKFSKKGTNIGDKVFIINYDYKIVKGTIIENNTEVEINGKTIKNLIKTDINLSPGDSGGPLLNSNYEVIGVNIIGSEEGYGYSSKF